MDNEDSVHINSDKTWKSYVSVVLAFIGRESLVFLSHLTFTFEPRLHSNFVFDVHGAA